MRDNGRGIPVGPHPKFKNKSALEVILTTLHSGAKFSQQGLCHLGRPARRRPLGGERPGRRADRRGGTRPPPLPPELSTGQAQGQAAGRRARCRTAAAPPSPFIPTRRSSVTASAFQPGPAAPHGPLQGLPATAVSRSAGAARPSCWIDKDDSTPATATLHFPGGLGKTSSPPSWASAGPSPPSPSPARPSFPTDEGRVEWAITWPADETGFLTSYCNTVPTPDGGSHEQGLRGGLLRSLKAYGELVGAKKSRPGDQPTICLGGACCVLSVFIKDPQFQGQTKEKLATPHGPAAGGIHHQGPLRPLALRPSRARPRAPGPGDRAGRGAPAPAPGARTEPQDRDPQAAPARQAGRLFAQPLSGGTEIFLVEGDSAGGSAKQARDRETQAVLPLRGKILNVASATADKIKANQEISDITLALGCGMPRRLRSRQAALRAGRDHDRRRRRRRPHRLAA